MEFFESSASNDSNIVEVGPSPAACAQRALCLNRNVRKYLHGQRTHILPLSSQSFTRVAELVLQAHKRDVESLLGSLDDYLDQVDLEGKKGLDGNDNMQKTCAC